MQFESLEPDVIRFSLMEYQTRGLYDSIGKRYTICMIVLGICVAVVIPVFTYMLNEYDPSMEFVGVATAGMLIVLIALLLPLGIRMAVKENQIVSIHVNGPGKELQIQYSRKNGLPVNTTRLPLPGITSVEIRLSCGMGEFFKNRPEMPADIFTCDVTIKSRDLPSQNSPFLQIRLTTAPQRVETLTRDRDCATQFVYEFERVMRKYSPVTNITIVNTSPEIPKIVAAAERAEQIGDSATVIGQYRRGISIAPRNEQCMNNLAIAYLHEKNNDEAIALLEKSFEYHPDSEATQFNLGVAYECKADWRRAAQLYRRVLARNRGHKTAWHQLSKVLINSHHNAGWIQAVRMHVSVNPTHATAWFDLGRSLFFCHEFPGAQYSIMEALRLDPSNREALFFSWLTRFSIGEAETVRSELLKAIITNDGNPCMLELLGLVEFKLGDRENAAKTRERADMAYHNYSQLATSLIMTNRTHDLPRANILGGSLIKKYPDNKSLLPTIAMIRFHLGKDAEALDLIISETSHFPDYFAMAESLHIIKWIYGLKKESAEIFESIMKDHHDDDAALINIAYHYMYENKTIDAVHALQMADQLNPYYPEARLGLVIQHLYESNFLAVREDIQRLLTQFSHYALFEYLSHLIDEKYAGDLNQLANISTRPNFFDRFEMFDFYSAHAILTAIDDYVNRAKLTWYLMGKHPFYEWTWITRAEALFDAGEFGAAIEACMRALTIDPWNYGAKVLLADAFLLSGNIDEAGKNIDALVASYDEKRIRIQELRVRYHLSKRNQEVDIAQKILIKAYSPGVESACLDYANAAVALATNEGERALELLKRAFSQDPPLKRRVVKDRLFNALKDDARLHAILK
jgi:tetratricopeptide (TPR) repeat protein